MPDKYLQLFVIGDTGSGKSWFIMRYMEESIPDGDQPQELDFVSTSANNYKNKFNYIYLLILNAEFCHIRQ